MTRAVNTRRQLTTEERAIRRQNRLDKRRRESLSLFATNEQVLDSVQSLPSVTEIMDWQLRQEIAVRVQCLRMMRTSLAAWIRYRMIVEQYITFDQVRLMESDCRRTLPPYTTSPEYRADYWHQVLRALGLLPGESQMCRTRRMYLRQAYPEGIQQPLRGAGA